MSVLVAPTDTLGTPAGSVSPLNSGHLAVPAKPVHSARRRDLGARHSAPFQCNFPLLADRRDPLGLHAHSEGETAVDVIHK